MKRSEVVRRLRSSGLNESGGVLMVDLEQYQRPVDGTPVDSVALLGTALGVEVEPDEPELPERIYRLELLSGSSCTPHVWRILTDGTTLAINSPSGVFDRKLAEALVAAYNNRPRWRTGPPPENGFLYLVRYRDDEAAPPRGDRDWRWQYALARWERPGFGWAWRRSTDAGWLHGAGSEWMEIP